MATRRLLVEIIGDDASLQRTLGRSGAAASGFGAKVSAIGDHVSKVGHKLTKDITLPLVALGTIGVVKAEELRKAQDSLAVAIDHTGGNTKKLLPEYQATARAAAEFGKNQIDATTALARATLLTGSAAAAQRAYEEALVISKATGKDFNAVLTATSKGQDGVTTSLQRYGILIPKGTAGTEQYRKVMARFGGQAAANTSAVDKLRAKSVNLAANLGTILLPILDRVVGFVGKLVDRFEKLSPSTQKIILVAIGLAAAIGPVVSVVGALVTAIGFLITPVGAIVVGIGLLVAVFAAAVLWPDKLKAGLERMGLSAHASGEIVAGLRHVFEVIRQAGERLVAAFRAHWDTIRAVLKGAWAYISATVRNGLQVVRGVFEVISGLIHGDWSKVWQGIKDIVGGTLKQIWNNLKTEGKVLVAVASAVGNAMWNGLKSGATSVINWIIGKLNYLIDKYNLVAGWLTGNIGAIGKVGGGGNPTAGPTGSHGPGWGGQGHAAGIMNATRGHWAMVGERGPELSYVPRGGSVFPHGTFPGGGGPVTLNATIIVPGYVGDRNELGERVVTALSQYARRNGNQALRAVLGAAGA